MATWNYERSQKRIEARISEVKDVEISDYSRAISLANIPTAKAYRVDGVHLYIDILNIGEMLNSTKVEGVSCHQRTLRFLNLHYRAVHRILNDCGVIRVDFHNQRLHAVVAKPYNTEQDAEAKRVRRAVAIAQLICDVLLETGESDQKIPNALVRVGIDSGKTLVVNNGRSGGREPLFLGHAANYSAKLAAAANVEGIFLSNAARSVIGYKKVEAEGETALTTDEVKECQDASALETSKDKIVAAWQKDLDDNPISAFEFKRQTPPLKDMDIQSLTPANSRRQELLSTYADIDGFTAYIQRNICEKEEDCVRIFHVIRSELDSVIHSDFNGRRIRFVGDCIHGVVCEGTAHTTDERATVSTGVLCAGGLRSSFELSLKLLKDKGIDVAGLGLAIGLDLGPTATSRLGMQGDRVRCTVGRAVISSEAEQARCNGKETSIGESAYGSASDAVKGIFASERKATDLDFDEAVDALAERNDETAISTKSESLAAFSPSVASTANVRVTPYATSN